MSSRMHKLVHSLSAEEDAAAAAEGGIGIGGRRFHSPVGVGAAVPVNVDAMDRGQKIALAVFIIRSSNQIEHYIFF